uniref:Uncharacterized protein n=1 Tax=Oryza nivara TaxID=4536 RepID=A0A0E0GZJ4_ORYNI
MMSSTLAAGTSWHLAANECTPSGTVEVAEAESAAAGATNANHTYLMYNWSPPTSASGTKAVMTLHDFNRLAPQGKYGGHGRVQQQIHNIPRDFVVVLSTEWDWLPAAMRGPNAIAVSPDVWDALGLGTTCTKDRK